MTKQACTLLCKEANVSFLWPQFSDKCIIPMNHVLGIFTPLRNVAGLQYKVKSEDFDLTTEKFLNLNS